MNGFRICGFRFCLCRFRTTTTTKTENNKSLLYFVGIRNFEICNITFLAVGSGTFLYLGKLSFRGGIYVLLWSLPAITDICSISLLKYNWQQGIGIPVLGTIHDTLLDSKTSRISDWPFQTRELHIKSLTRSSSIPMALIFLRDCAWFQRPSWVTFSKMPEHSRDLGWKMWFDHVPGLVNNQTNWAIGISSPPHKPPKISAAHNMPQIKFKD